MNITQKKSIVDIVNQEIPGLKVYDMESIDSTLYYGTNSSEDDIQKLKGLLKKLGLKTKIERIPF